MGLVRLNRPIGGVPVSEDAGCPAPPPCEALTQRWVERKKKHARLPKRETPTYDPETYGKK